MSIKVILIIIAIVLWGLEAIAWPKTAVHLGWAGMVAFGLSLLVK